MSETIASVTGVIAFADGKEAQFSLTAEGSSRWGEVTEILGRAVAPCEAMQAALAGIHAFESEPQPGETVRYEFTARDDAGKTVSVIEVRATRMAANPDFGRDEPWDRLEISDVGDVLDAWANAEPKSRSWTWPDTESASDPAVVAFIGMGDGKLHQDQWSAVDDNEYDAEDLGAVLPAHSFDMTVVGS